MELNEIALRCGADKGSNCHWYTRYYEKYLSYLRHEPVRLLELGVDKGQSLRMWHEYFSQATIIGVDINPPVALNLPRVLVLQANQTDEPFLRNLGQQDIVIDDASHRNIETTTSFNILFPMVKTGGWYIIEDLACSYWDGTIYDTGRPRFIEYLKSLIDDLMGHGKSTWGYNETEDPLYKLQHLGQGLYNDNEKMIEEMHFYRNICFIKKR